MAAVYQATDDGGGVAAVKVMHPDHSTNPNVIGRFKREAFIMGLSSHPRAVRVYEEGFTEINEPYYAMELLSSESLKDRWKMIELFDPLRAIGYIESLLEVLETYHAHGVIHRDIKPANLIMDGDAVRLVDFGVSRYRDEHMTPEDYTRQGSMIGTPAYMAPEQAMGEVDRMDQRTDLFAVGAVLYALVSGKQIHEGRTSEEKLVKAASTPAESVARYAPDLPGILIAFIDTSLAWFPADRFQTASEMLDELSYVKEIVRRAQGVVPAEAPAESDAHVSPPPTKFDGGAKFPTGPSRAPSPFDGAGILPAGFEMPDFSKRAPDDDPSRVYAETDNSDESHSINYAELSDPSDESVASGASEVSETFHTAFIEPDSEAVDTGGDASIFDSAIFKPSEEFNRQLQSGRVSGRPLSPAPDPEPHSEPAPSAPRFAIGQPSHEPPPSAPPRDTSFPSPKFESPQFEGSKAETYQRPAPSNEWNDSTSSATRSRGRSRLREMHESAQRESDIERAAAIAFDSAAQPDFDDAEVESGFNAQLLLPVFRAIERAFAGARMYDWEHPDVERRLEHAFDEVLEVLAIFPDHCAFQVRRANFAVNDEPVWHPGDPFDKIPFNLFTAGFRHIRFLPNLTKEDLTRFLKLAMLNPKVDLPLEDDLATAFWDLDLSSIQAQMVTSFRVSDDENEQKRFERDVEAIESELYGFFAGPGAEQLKVLLALAELGEGALAQAHYSRPELLLARRLNRGTFAQAYRKQFVEALSRDLWLQRAVFVLVAALLDVVREGDPERLAEPLRELVPRFLLEGEIDELLELIDKVARAVPEDSTRDLVFDWVFDKRNVDRFVRYLRNHEGRLQPDTQSRAVTYLREGDGEAVAQVLPAYVELAGHKREIVTPYLARHCAGNQELFGEAIVTAPTDAAVELVGVLGAVTDLATANALKRILNHADVAVREKALTQMAESYPAEVEDILFEMVQDDDANLRVQALKLALASKSRAVEDFLAERAKSGDFHELPFTERRLIIETLFGIDPRRGEATAVEIVRRKLNLRLDPAAHTSRTIAMSILGERGVTEDGYFALEDAAKRRIGNPEKVREAARTAMQRWIART